MSKITPIPPITVDEVNKFLESDCAFDTEKINQQLEKLRYAEQQSIEFANWVIDKNYFSIDPENGRLFFKIGNPQKYTSAELYQLFLNDQNKTTTCKICSRILPEEVRHCEINDCPHK
jgi:hypothetical protein